MNRRGIQGGVASALPWVLTFAALALFILAAVAHAEETQILAARWVLDVEHGEMIENGVIVVSGDRIAATVNAASAVGLANQIGTLKTGAFADIIAVEGSPLTDIRALQKIKYVMKAGRPVDRNTL